MAESEAIIIDNGSSFTKAGFPDEAPRIVFQTVVGRTKNPKDAYIGDEVRYTDVKCEYPVEQGMIKNWEDIEKIWNYIFSKELRVDPSEHTILLTEVPNNSKPNRTKMAQIMFETFNVPSFYVASQAVLSIYASENKTGIVFESGAGASNVVPIKNGNSISKSIINFPIAGNNLSDWCLKISGSKFVPSDAVLRKQLFDIAENIKEMCDYVALDYDAELKKAKSTSKCEVDYTNVVDNSNIKLNDERFRCPELLFKPRMNGFECDGIDKCIFNSIMNCDASVRNDLFRNIIVSGGNTLFEGFPERLEKEIKNLAPPNTQVKVVADPGRKYSAWLGGALFASQADFPQQIITHDEYNDKGPEIVNIKCNK